MTPRQTLLAAKVPRYTSYPTAPHFHAGVGPASFREWLAVIPQETPLSLYLHIPFCDSLCWFCACHTSVVNSYGPIGAYVELLQREIALVADSLSGMRRVGHVHFGGGSPSMLSVDDIGLLFGVLRQRFLIQPDAEIAVEIDPRGFRAETVNAFARAGVTRASIGVQDASPVVQAAINRFQPMQVTQDAVTMLRDAGICDLNIDLIYGLPHQTKDDLLHTIDAVIALAPARLAIFGYAHVPEMKRHQHLIDVTALPDSDARIAQYEAAQAHLCTQGYQPIGLDHFARPDDAMAVAACNGTLSRNFQGYTTDCADTLIGFGASAISSLPAGYVQNASATPDYRACVMAGVPATARGRELTDGDRMRRAIIERLMCDLRVDLAEIAARFGSIPHDFLRERAALAELEAQGLVSLSGDVVTIPAQQRATLRIVAAVFDAYLDQTQRHSVAV